MLLSGTSTLWPNLFVDTNSSNRIMHFSKWLLINVLDICRKIPTFEPIELKPLGLSKCSQRLSKWCRCIDGFERYRVLIMIHLAVGMLSSLRFF